MILYSSVSKQEDCYLITVRNIPLAQWLNGSMTFLVISWGIRSMLPTRSDQLSELTEKINKIPFLRLMLVAF